uniref:Uncharacterized protein n=1 Tax=viral metagenome TaxID=1070528 RepID=A0A6M3IVB4_9ZZZZ
MNDHYWAEKKAEREDAMNPIEKLVADRNAISVSNSALEERVYAYHNLIDAFAEGHEVLEVQEHGGDKMTPFPHGHWLVSDCDGYEDRKRKPTYRRTTYAIVPRKKPGLREAAAELLAWMDGGYHDKDIGTLRTNLAAALKEGDV